MTTPKLSLCIITGNEECHAERFFASFGPAFDELCIVRAVGNQAHDKTVSIAKAYCEKHGKKFKFAEYRNAGWMAGQSLDLEVRDDYAATWKHVDDFAAARNMSWDLATGTHQFWADLDDVLAPGSAELIRKCADTEIDVWFFRYEIRTSLESNMRERLFKRGTARWSQPVHENCRHHDEKIKVAYEKSVIYSHEPEVKKERDPNRNSRIEAWHLRYLKAFAFELHREAYYKWAWRKDPKDAEQATYWAEVAHAADTLPEMRYDMLCNMAHITSETDPQHAIDLCWSAIRVSPGRRDAWGYAAEYELKQGNAQRAVLLTRIMGAFNKPTDTGHPMSQKFFGWQGMLLSTRAQRAAGKHEEALRYENTYFEKHGRRISLIHATRGRPQKALEARNFFFSAASCPLGVEHIFAIDEDDAESLEALKYYRHVVVRNPNGCVKAWNTAAAESTGAVLVQLSDDWSPCVNWDEHIWQALQNAAAKRIHEKLGADVAITPEAVRETSLVLAVNDGHRTDALLCMAIMTRARYEQQGKEMFSGEYFGVFSDNEFTVRAYADGVVVQAQHIPFKHNHPVFEGKPVDQWDATHQRQNAPERYREGMAIYNRRNPEHMISIVREQKP